jgi:hypothetical protein
MCQSKSNGGMRCESHAKKAIAEHQIAYSNMVQQECADKGIKINPASLELTADEISQVKSQLHTDASIQKTRADAQKATQKLKKLKDSLTEALSSGDVNRLAMLVRQNDPEQQSIIDDNEARRLKFADEMANAANETQKDEIIANNKTAYDLLNRRKEKLNFLSKKEAVNSSNIYRATRNNQRALTSLVCVQKADKDALEAREAGSAKIERVRGQMMETAITNKLINDPGFQEVASSETFRSSEAFQKWDAKENELMESYRMTSGYQNQVAAKISAYKKAGMDTTEMESAYKALTVRKAKSSYQNIAEAHGVASPEAKKAREAYDEAKRKEHSF